VIRHGALRAPTEMDEKALQPAAIFSWGAFSVKLLILRLFFVGLFRRKHHGAAARHPPGRMKMGVA